MKESSLHLSLMRRINVSDKDEVLIFKTHKSEIKQIPDIDDPVLSSELQKYSKEFDENSILEIRKNVLITLSDVYFTVFRRNIGSVKLAN